MNFFPRLRLHAMPLILSLDGGGVRGIATLEFLHELDQWLRETKRKSLQDVFDIYIGTSTGALIVSSLTYLNMRPDVISATFYSLERLRLIMPSLSWYSFMRFYLVPMYDGVAKRHMIDSYISDGTMHDLFRHACPSKRILIPTYNLQTRSPRVYDSHADSTSHTSFREILDASTSPPVYFPPVLVNGQYEADGGIYANSPAIIGATLGFVESPTDFKILSIGTGRSKKSAPEFGADFYGGLLGWLRNNLVDILLGAPQSFHNELLINILGKRFLRVNGELKTDSYNVSYTLDDTSETNIEELKKMGRYWFRTYREDIETFFSHV